MTADGPGKADGQRRLRWWPIAICVFGIVLLSVLIWRSRIWDAGDTLRQVDALTLVLVPLLSLAMAAPLALRSRFILAALGHPFSASSLAAVSFYGNMVGYLTPASSGELLRPALLERGFGLSKARGAAVVVYERFFSMYLMGLSALFAFTWTDAVPVTVALALMPILAALTLVPMGILRLLNLRLRRASERLPGFIQTRIAGLSEAGDASDVLWRSARLSVQFAVLSMAVFGIMAVQFWLLVEGTGGSISPAEAWVVLFVANMAGVLSGLPLGLGASDALTVSLLNAYGVDLATAVAVAFLVRLLINLPNGLLVFVAYVLAARRSTPSRAKEDPAARVLSSAAGERS